MIEQVILPPQLSCPFKKNLQSVTITEALIKDPTQELILPTKKSTQKRDASIAYK